MNKSGSQEKAKQNFRVQLWVAAISVVLLLVKFTAWFMTHSVAILTDALESIVNVSAGFLGLYSLYISAKPRDENHPYGHGKIEFISASVEGTMIGAAGAIILYKAIKNFFHPVALQQLDFGLLLVAISAVVNFMTGFFCLRIGKQNKSAALIASGHHLQSDTISTAGILAGLALLFLTGYQWIDSLVAIVFALYIIYTGYRIIRSSIAGIMDETDIQLLEKMVTLLNQQRRENWIDLHNLRVIKYGSVLHLDCHLTVPWYLNVHEAHREVDALASQIRNGFGNALELFVHTDGCLPFSCRLCAKESCQERKFAFEKQVSWTLKNVSFNKKHEL